MYRRVYVHLSTDGSVYIRREDMVNYLIEGLTRHEMGNMSKDTLIEIILALDKQLENKAI